MDGVYERLVALKRPQESFSDELRRLTETKGSIMEFAGIWKDMSDEDAQEMKETIRKSKKTTRMKEILQRFEE